MVPDAAECHAALTVHNHKAAVTLPAPDRAARMNIVLTRPRLVDRQRAAATGRAQLASTILGTFREMPGLCLHVTQAARLLGLRRAVCEPVLDDLVHRGLLRRRFDGSYLLA
jgi:hypothetical protein